MWELLQRQSERRQLLLLLSAAAALILAGMGLRDPWPADEPRFALMGRDMWLTGNWLIPIRGGELYPDKPPVFMWLIGLFYGLTDNLRVAFMLPSALAGLGTLALVYDLGRRLWSHRVGMLAGLLLLASFQFVLQAKTAQIDALVCFWITLGCYGLLRHLLVGPAWGWYGLGWFAMGLGIITKGVGFLPLLLLLPYLLLRWSSPQTQELAWSRRWLIGPLLLLLAVLLWVGPMLFQVALSDDPMFAEYRDNILFKQTAERYANSWGHIKPFWYYLVEVIPLFWLPLSLMLPWLLKPWWQALRQGDRRLLLPLVWIVLVVLFFSLSPGKRGVYLLPALPMLALIVAPYAEQILQQRLFQWLLWGITSLLTSLLVLLGIGGLLGVEKLLAKVSEYEVEPWWMLLCLGGVGLALCLWQRRRPLLGWVMFMPLLWLTYSFWGYPLMNAARTPKNVMEHAFELLPAGGELAILEFKGQYLLFTPQPLTHFKFRASRQEQIAGAWQWVGEPLDKQPQRYVLLPDEKAFRNSGCFDLGQGLEVGFAHRDRWLLLPPSARQPECAAVEGPVRRFHYQPLR